MMLSYTRYLVSLVHYFAVVIFFRFFDSHCYRNSTEKKLPHAESVETRHIFPD